MSCNKLQFRQLVYAGEDFISECYDVANGLLSTGSDVSGSISSSAISRHILLSVSKLNH